MKRTLTREWNRVRTPSGILVYLTYVNEYTLVNVYRDGAHWVWVVIGYPVVVDGIDRPMILKHGSGQTKNEAQYYAEQLLPKQEQIPW